MFGVETPSNHKKKGTEHTTDRLHSTQYTRSVKSVSEQFSSERGSSRQVSEEVVSTD